MGSYVKLLTRYPVAIQSIQTGLLMGLGDVVAQFVIEKKTRQQYSLVRSVQFGSVGLFVIGPVLTTWYGHLAKLLGSHGSGAVAVKKVALDQLCFAPIGIALFVTSINVMQGKSWAYTKTELNEKYFDILTTNYLVWPWFQLANFYLVPLHHQVLFAQIVALFWNVYMSWKTQEHHESPKELK